ncbi:glycoside hydrolase family 15 protein [Streptomyces sp. NPDC028722]|uniref:glycoside hydrolase family 15 protein n=1 Tax=Streptomyces sp. NPDC028722 TaxID=3155016 RepID=UPI0033D495CC
MHHLCYQAWGLLLESTAPHPARAEPGIVSARSRADRRIAPGPCRTRVPRGASSLARSRSWQESHRLPRPSSRSVHCETEAVPWRARSLSNGPHNTGLHQVGWCSVRPPGSGGSVPAGCPAAQPSPVAGTPGPPVRPSPAADPRAALLTGSSPPGSSAVPGEGAASSRASGRRATKAGFEVGHHAWSASLTNPDRLADNWDQPEEGLWEPHGGRQQVTYGRVMSWVAFDRALRLAESNGRPAATARRSSERDAIYEPITDKGRGGANWATSRRRSLISPSSTPPSP